MYLRYVLPAFGSGLFLSSLTLAAPLVDREVVEVTNTGPTVFTPGCGTHSETNRACWKGEFNISTDYEQLVPEGITRKVSYSYFPITVQSKR
jgi:hypothetical protein